MNTSHSLYAGKYKKYALLMVCCSLFATAHANQTQAETATTSLLYRDGQVHSGKAQVTGGLLIAEHDMIVGHATPLRDLRKQSRGLTNTKFGHLWPNGVVPYRLGTSLSESAAQKVNDAIAHWNSVAAITLIERTSANASAYPDYIDFISEDRCASWIGYQGGAQFIYAGDKCSTGTMIHEIGHALGLLHEHTRSDRDQYVTVRWDRIQANMEPNFEILDANVQLGDYDYHSIMHYGEYFFSRNGLPTIVPVMDTDATIGQRIETSSGDRNAIQKLYESDLALVAHSSGASVTAGEPYELTLQVTNNYSIGANTLSISLPTEEHTQLLSFSSSAWSCAQLQSANNIKCTTPVLAAGASSSVTLRLDTGNTTGLMQFYAELTSRTHDRNLTDNSDSLTILVGDENATNPIPVLASANADPTTPQSTNPLETQQSGHADTTPMMASAMDGGGSFDHKLFAFLLVLLGGMHCRKSLTRQQCR